MFSVSNLIRSSPNSPRSFSYFLRTFSSSSIDFFINSQLLMSIKLNVAFTTSIPPAPISSPPIMALPPTTSTVPPATTPMPVSSPPTAKILLSLP